MFETKRFFASVTLLSVWWHGCAYASAKESVDKELAKEISEIELRIVGKAPGHESVEERLQSIESKLFGAPQNGTLFDRLTHIKTAMAATVSAPGTALSGTSTDAWPAFSQTPATDASAAAGSTAATATTATTATTSTSGITPTLSPAPYAMAVASAAPPLVQPISPSPADLEMSADDSAADGWPVALPRVDLKSQKQKSPLVAEVNETVDPETAAVRALKNAPDKEVYDKANDALNNGNYKLAIKAFGMLAERKPRDPRYVYGEGMAYKGEGDYENAFPNLLLSWHLGNASVYTDAVNSLIPAMKKSIDDTFKVTFDHTAGEPEAVLNAGVRLWKSGLNDQAVKLFEYTMKNDPLYRGAAAYNLGAIAEHNGNVKLALEYYKWAAHENHKLEGVAEHSPAFAAAINKSLNLFPHGYIEAAVSDTQQKLLRGNTAWNGWQQSVTRPQHWSSEVCPLCGISRTSRDYRAGQMAIE